MKKEIKEQWIAALTSGEYQQTVGALANRDAEGATSYCCLGVLCDLAVKAGVIEEPEVNEDYRRLNYDGEEAVLPPSVQVWAGTDDRGNNPDGPDLGLASKNDRGSSFSEISAIISRNL